MRAFRPRSLPRNLVKNPGDDCFVSTVRSVSCATFNLSLFTLIYGNRGTNLTTRSLIVFHCSAYTPIIMVARPRTSMIDEITLFTYDLYSPSFLDYRIFSWTFGLLYLFVAELPRFLLRLFFASEEGFYRLSSRLRNSLR